MASHDEVCEILYRDRNDSMYALLVKRFNILAEVGFEFDKELVDIKRAIEEDKVDHARKLVHLVIERTERYTQCVPELHRINAEICAQEAAECDSPLNKASFLEGGITCATKLVNLKPNDIDSQFILLWLRSKKALGSQDRQLLIQECEEALKIDTQDPRGSRPKIRSLLQRMEDRHQRIESAWESIVSGPNIDVTIDDLAAHFSLRLMDESASKAVTDVLEYRNSHPSWEFWQCCCRDHKFDSYDRFITHLLDAHVEIPQSFEKISKDDESLPSRTYVERFPPARKESIVADVSSSSFKVDPKCVLYVNDDASQTPPREKWITTLSYRPALHHWEHVIESRNRLGAQLIQFLPKLITRRSREEAMNAVKTLSEDIDSKIKENGVWIYRSETRRKEELKLRDNPLGSYDYRDLLLRYLKSYIAWLVEKKADEERRRQATNRLNSQEVSVSQRS